MPNFLYCEGNTNQRFSRWNSSHPMMVQKKGNAGLVNFNRRKLQKRGKRNENRQQVELVLQSVLPCLTNLELEYRSSGKLHVAAQLVNVVFTALQTVLSFVAIYVIIHVTTTTALSFGFFVVGKPLVPPFPFHTHTQRKEKQRNVHFLLLFSDWNIWSHGN